MSASDTQYKSNLRFVCLLGPYVLAISVTLNIKVTLVFVCLLGPYVRAISETLDAKVVLGLSVCWGLMS